MGTFDISETFLLIIKFILSAIVAGISYKLLQLINNL